MAKIRVRFAPSPTGYLHVGNARTALCNYFFAKKMGGDFIVRIEDTDQERNIEEAIDQIIADLRWLDIEWDEGPNMGGVYGPYRQSLRNKLYQEHIETLIQNAQVYPCYCSKEELEQRRAQAVAAGQVPRYDNRCRFLTDEQKNQFESQGRKPVWRFKVEPQQIVINDLIRGEISFDTGLMGDFIVFRADRTPTFHLTVTIDDAMMHISHVIRGEDHLSNTPRHVLLFRALGYAVPQFAHLSLLKGIDSEMLSKREMNDLYSVAGLRAKGYLPEAVINYLVNIGVSVEDGKEIMNVDELIDRFDLDAMSKSVATFDVDKLNWYAGYYIRSADVVRIADLTMPYLKEQQLVEGNLTEEQYQYLLNVVDVIRHNVTCLSQMVEYASIFFTDSIELDDDTARAVRSDVNRAILDRLVELLEQADEPITGETFNYIMSRLREMTSVQGKELFKPIRWVLTGKAHGPELEDVFVLLGKNKVIERILTVMKKYEYIDHS